VSYRHPRYHNQKTLLTPLETMAIGMGVLVCTPIVLVLIATAVNSAPIVRKGQFCPVHYYRTGEYCTPTKSTTPSAVRIIDETCPIGTYTQSDYCVTAQ